MVSLSWNSQLAQATEMLYMRLDTMNTTCVDRYKVAPSFFFFFFNIWLQWVLAAACEIQFPDQESNPSSPKLGAESSHCTTREVPAFIYSVSSFYSLYFIKVFDQKNFCPLRISKLVFLFLPPANNPIYNKAHTCCNIAFHFLVLIFNVKWYPCWSFV